MVLVYYIIWHQFSSVQFSRSVMSSSLRPHELQHTRPPCPSPTTGVDPNSCPLSLWCHLAISSSVVPFSSCPQSLLASGSFPVSQIFTWGGQSTGVSASASVLPVNTQDWSPLEWTGWLSLQSKITIYCHLWSCPLSGLAGWSSFEVCCGCRQMLMGLKASEGSTGLAIWKLSATAATIGLYVVGLLTAQ